MNSSVSNNLGVVKKGKKKLNPTLIGVILVVIVMIGYAIMTSPKIIMLNSANNLYKEFTNLVSKVDNSEIGELAKSNAIQTNSNITFDADFGNNAPAELSGIKNLISNLVIKYNNVEDLSNKERLLKLDASLGNSSLINLTLYTENNNNYLYLNKAYDKYIKVSNGEYTSVYNEQSIIDIEYLVNKIKGSLINNIKGSDLKSSTDKATYNGKSHYVTKVTLTITDKRIKEILKAVLTDLKNDNTSLKVINHLSSNSDTTTSIADMKNTLSTMIKELDSKNKILEDNIYISVYTKGLLKNAFKYEIKTNDTVISYMSYIDNSNTNIKELRYGTNSDSVALTLSSNKDHTTFAVKQNNTNIIDGTYASTFKEIVGNQKYNSNQNIAVKFNKDVIGSEFTLAIKVDSNIIVGAGIAKPDVSASVDMNKLSIDEINSITENIQNNFLGALMSGANN